MKLWRWVWWSLGVGVTLQFAYWAAMEIGYGLSITAPPQVGHDWLFFAFANSVFWFGERAYNEAQKLLKE